METSLIVSLAVVAVIVLILFKTAVIVPQQNAYVERYNRTVRTEWLGRYHFNTIEDVQDHATQWLWTYNNERPNMGIGGVTPIQKLNAA